MPFTQPLFPQHLRQWTTTTTPMKSPFPHHNPAKRSNNAPGANAPKACATAPAHLIRNFVPIHEHPCNKAENPLAP